MDQKDIENRATEFANDLMGPLGPKPLEKILRQHVGLFADLRDAGASWNQIAALMVRHGIKRKDGGVVDATQWAAMVSRVGRIGKPEDEGASLRESKITPQMNTRASSSSAAPTDLRDRRSLRERMRSSHAVREE